MEVPPCAAGVGRGTIHRRVNGGGATGAGVLYPSTMLRMVPLPIASRRGGTEAPPSSPLPHLRMPPPRLDPVDNRPAAGVEQRIGARAGHPTGPVGLGPVDHVSGEVREQEEEGRAEQALQASKSAAEH